MADAEVRFDPVLLSGNETLLLMAAREGMGFAFVPRVIVEDDLAAGTLEHLLPTTLTPSAPLCAIYPNRTHLPARVRTFLDFLVEDGRGEEVGSAAQIARHHTQAQIAHSGDTSP